MFTNEFYGTLLIIHTVKDGKRYILLNYTLSKVEGLPRRLKYIDSEYHVAVRDLQHQVGVISVYDAFKDIVYFGPSLDLTYSTHVAAFELNDTLVDWELMKIKRIYLRADASEDIRHSWFVPFEEFKASEEYERTAIDHLLEYLRRRKDGTLASTSSFYRLEGEEEEEQ